MKRIALFHWVLLSVFFFVQNTEAENTSDKLNSSNITIKLPAMDVVAGKNFTVPVETSHLDSSLSIVSYQFNLAFDHSKLEFKGINQVATLSSAGIIEVNTMTPGKLKLACINSHPMKGLGKLIQLDFKAIAAGNSSIQITDFLFNTDSVKKISNDTIKIFTKYGDTDGNDFIQAYDAALVLQHSVGLEPLPLSDSIPWENWRKIASDVDLINDLTANDAGLILKKSIGLIDFFPAEADNPQAMKAPLLNAAEVTITKEWNNLVFRSYGNLIGLNLSLTDNYNILDQPTDIYNKFMNATNISENTYRVGLATANPPVDGTVIMTIPIKESNVSEILVKLVINNQFKDVKANVMTSVDNTKDNYFRIYPNPVKDNLMLNFGATDISGLQLKLVNILGQIVYQGEVSQTLMQINMNQFSNGSVYTLIISDNKNNIIHRQKIVRE